MLTLCICHSTSEDPQPSPPRSRHQQAAGFLRKGLFSYHLCGNKRKAYILKIVPEDSILLIYLRFLLFFLLDDWSAKWRGKRQAKVYRSWLKKLHCSEREREGSIIGRLKEILAYFTLLHAWTENLFRSHSLLFPAWWQPCCWVTGILQWSTFLGTRPWHPTSSNMCRSQEKLGLVIFHH